MTMVGRGGGQGADRMIGRSSREREPRDSEDLPLWPFRDERLVVVVVNLVR